ncbi:MAG TPA: hypothetical protein ENK58_05320 [Desulfobacterales bacterium]|nr:hypothetical protein [Desulfobacterales bacterium]
MNTYISPTIGKILGVILMIVSMIFTVQLLTSFANDGFNKIVYTAFGIAIQGCQTLMFLYFWLQGRQWGAILFLFLCCLSLIGTIGFFSVNDAEQLQLGQNSDVRYNLMKQRSASLEKQVRSAEDQISDYASRRYFTKGVKPTQKILERLQKEQSELHNQMVNFTPEPPSQALYSFLGDFFKMPVKQVKLALFTAYALALDICAVFLLAYSMSDTGNSRVNPNMLSGANTNIAVGSGSIRQRYETALFNSQKADGSLAGQRKIADQIGCSNEQASEIHRQMKKEGLIDVQGTKTYPSSKII